MSYTDNLPLPYGFGDTTTGTTPTNPTTGLHNRLNLNQIKPGTTHTIDLYEFEPDPIQRAKLYASVKNWCLNQTGWVLKKKGTDIIVRRRLK